MSQLGRFKNNTYCDGGEHYSGTLANYCFVSAKRTKMLEATCIKCKLYESMTLSDAVIETEGSWKTSLRMLLKLYLVLENFFNSLVRALEIASNIDTSMATRNHSRVLLSTPDLIGFVTRE